VIFVMQAFFDTYNQESVVHFFLRKVSTCVLKLFQLLRNAKLRQYSESLLGKYVSGEGIIYALMESR